MIFTGEITDFLVDKGIFPVIIGPTASGKTSVSLRLAEILDSEIISADSRQMYKLMDIGTAKPTKDELSRVKHHYIDCLDLTENYSSGKFGDSAEKTLKEIFTSKKLPLVVGGSGLYIKSLCEGLFDEDDLVGRENVRNELQERLQNEGIDTLYNELMRADQESALKYSDKNPRRIIRALEYFLITSDKFSEVHKNKKKERLFKPVYFGIRLAREILYLNINHRTLEMWENGLTDEARRILELGYSEDLNSLNTVGYKESFSYLKGELSDAEAISLIQKNTRHYAKRQLTWFNRIENVYWLDFKNPLQFADEMIEILKSVVSSGRNKIN